MKTMKRAVTVFLMLSVCAFFVACGSDDDDDNTTKGPGGLSGGGLSGGGLGGGGSGGGLGGGGGGGGSLDDTPLKDLTDTQAVQVCNASFAETNKQNNAYTPIGRGSCLAQSIIFALNNYQKKNMSQIALCESEYDDCIDLYTEYMTSWDYSSCLPSDLRSGCSATAQTFYTCFDSRGKIENTIYENTAELKCADILSSQEIFDKYAALFEDSDKHCTPLVQQCPHLFE